MAHSHNAHSHSEHNSHDAHNHHSHSADSHARGRSHSGSTSGSGGDGNIGLAFFLNLSFTVIELIGGLLTNSIAIMSDAIHDFGDSLSLALAWYFQKKSKKGSTGQYTYGYKRFSFLGAIITSVVLILGSIFILLEAVPRIFSPQETNAAGMFALAILGIAVNGFAVLRTRKAGSINEKVVSLHLLEDALGWAAVLAGSAVMYFTGLTVIDPILSVAISCFVLFNVFRNIRQVMQILLQGSPAGIDRERIVERLREIGQISDVHDLHIWAMDEEHNVLTVHVTLSNILPMDELAQLKETIRAALKEEDINHATIEFETPSEPCDFTDCV